MAIKKKKKNHFVPGLASMIVRLFLRANKFDMSWFMLHEMSTGFG